MFCLPHSFNKYLAVQHHEHGFSWLIQQLFCQSVSSILPQPWSPLSYPVTTTFLNTSHRNRYWYPELIVYMLALVRWFTVRPTALIKLGEAYLKIKSSVGFMLYDEKTKTQHCKHKEMIGPPFIYNTCLYIIRKVKMCSCISLNIFSVYMHMSMNYDLLPDIQSLKEI